MTGVRPLGSSDGRSGATHAQAALAWTAAQPGITAPIASATGVAQLEELLGALPLELGENQIARLDGAGATGPFPAFAGRY